ncbi:doxx family protein [Zobellia galactanivorans]|uniref:DoxX family membrane protein n=1 Tax=Zobellia TaxID=112040 RepID=UPI0026E4870F|nr:MULTISPECIES: DoxX family membrane protein [Zobellia]MDO6517367.1 doxx family protein [Zobellia uliginosa]MDO6807324.1 doxx family protein [Zobellia galactanivorans]
MPTFKTSSILNHFKKISFLQISIAIVYLWFGVLKFFNDVSPAEELAKETITSLTFGLIPPNVSIVLLALLEVGIGTFLLFDLFRKQTVIVTLLHMVCTFSTLLLLNEASFTFSPFAPTLLGQYVIKNLIIVAALVSIYQGAKKA